MGFRSFDFFRKINTDVADTSSAFGGFLTLIAFILVCSLTVNECKLYLQTEMDYQTVIDNDTKQFIHVHIDLIVAAPCAIVSLDQQDEVGVHVLDVQDTLKKIRLDSKRRALPAVYYIFIKYEKRDNNYNGSEQQITDVIDAINNGEQCQLEGYFRINKVPGNFHVSYHAYHQIIQRIFQRDIQTFKKLRLDHSINDLHFGDYREISKLLLKYPKAFQKYMKPNDQWISISKKSPEDIKQDYEYHLNALPARVYDLSQKDYKTFYKYSINEVVMGRAYSEVDSIYFKYQISPVNMVYKYKDKSFYHLVVQLLAIIGGVFAVVGILNSILQRAF